MQREEKHYYLFNFKEAAEKHNKVHQWVFCTAKKFLFFVKSLLPQNFYIYMILENGFKYIQC